MIVSVSLIILVMAILSMLVGIAMFAVATIRERYHYYVTSIICSVSGIILMIVALVLATFFGI
jgi:hypothetical protein